jgi:hypothetical protein
MAEINVEQPALQLRFLNLNDFSQLIAVIDVAANRGAYKGEELSTVGRLRDTLLAESQEQSRLLQESTGATTTTQFGGSSATEESVEEEEVPKANKKK